MTDTYDTRCELTRVQFGGRAIGLDIPSRLRKKIRKQARKDFQWFVDRPHREYCARKAHNIDWIAFESAGYKRPSSPGQSPFVLIWRKHDCFLSYVWSAGVLPDSKSMAKRCYLLNEDREQTEESQISDLALEHEFHCLYLKSTGAWEGIQALLQGAHAHE